MQIVIIGLGAIGRMLVEGLADGASPVRIIGVAVRPARAAEARGELASDIALFTTPEEIIAAGPDMVVECAGQAALRQYGETLLAAGAAAAGVRPAWIWASAAMSPVPMATTKRGPFSLRIRCTPLMVKPLT